MLIELKDGGVAEIRTDNKSYGGCETCDYGSSYINCLTIIFVESPLLYIEASQMYEYPLSADFLMKLFLHNLEHIKTMTEAECRKYIINSIKEECSTGEAECSTVEVQGE